MNYIFMNFYALYQPIKQIKTQLNLISNDYFWPPSFCLTSQQQPPEPILEHHAGLPLSAVTARAPPTLHLSGEQRTGQSRARTHTHTPHIVSRRSVNVNNVISRVTQLLPPAAEQPEETGLRRRRSAGAEV